MWTPDVVGVGHVWAQVDDKNKKVSNNSSVFLIVNLFIYKYMKKILIIIFCYIPAVLFSQIKIDDIGDYNFIKSAKDKKVLFILLGW